MGRLRSLRRAVLLSAGTVLLVLGTACAPDTQNAVTVRVDYEHDEFATQFIKYFPDHIQVHPGDTVFFQQDWTGEAHTVTFGTLANDMLSVTKPLIEEWGDVPEDQIPPEILEAYFAAECSLPTLHGCFEEPAAGPGPESGPEEATEPEFTAEINQTIAQPCLIEEGTLPDDGAPCEIQELGEFDGTEAYFNSGFIGFETDRPNIFELQLSDSIQPGEYNFFCSVHGSFHSGTMEVVPSDQAIPSTAEVNLQTREELNEVVEPFRQVYNRAREGGQFVFGGEAFTGNFSGLMDERVQGLLNEFIPETIETKVNEPVTWLMFGPHSISFDVPEYFPIYERLEDGTIRANEEIYLPAGGAPEVEEQDTADPIVVDGGTWDGSEFWSSGVLFGDPIQYTLRFSTPGTYRYACLIHPPMVGTVVVTG